MQVTPYQNSDQSKRQQVEQMFDAIAPRYDLLNHTLSLGIDVLWRRTAIALLKARNPLFIVDIATGTGDFAYEALKLRPNKIIGVDISEGMLAVGRAKMKARAVESVIELRQGDSENLPFETDSVDAITVGFGVRNFEHLEKGLGEILRVLKPGGQAVILEPASPSAFPLKQIFNFYFSNILPLIGRLVSRSKEAYEYLPNSVKAFPNGPEFVQICQQVGFKNCQWKPLTFGICSLYLLEK
jgi:demethylmenaquinone methyltransferase/2-methoxy-6-polyprenyl-1,4-benzoquinol methylase